MATNYPKPGKGTRPLMGAAQMVATYGSCYCKPDQVLDDPQIAEYAIRHARAVKINGAIKSMILVACDAIEKLHAMRAEGLVHA